MYKNNKIINTIDMAGFAVLLILFVSAYGMKLYSVLTFDFPRELREMNLVVFAGAFSQGNNLYSKTVLNMTDPPAATSLYGILVPLLLAPFVRLLSYAGLSALQACELMTVFAEITGGIIAYKIVMLKTESRMVSMAGALLVCSCYWRYGAFGGAYPDQWGVTLGLLLAWLIDRNTTIISAASDPAALNCSEPKQTKGRHPQWLYALLLVCLLYVKQYFAFFTVGVVVYMFIYARRDVPKLIAWGIAEGIISVIIVCNLFPLYFTEIFPIAQGSTGNNGLWYSVSQIPEQLMWTYKYIFVVVAGGLICLIIACRDRFAEREGTDKKGSPDNNGNITALISYELCQVICVLPLCILIARNEGTRFTYYLQLWWPYVIIYTIGLIPVITDRLLSCGNTMISVIRDKDKDRMKEKNRDDDKNTDNTDMDSENIRNYIKTVAVSLVLAIALWDCKGLLFVKLPSDDERAAWNRAYEMLDEYREGNAILVSPHLSGYCLDHDIPTADYGQAEFNSEYSLEVYENNELFKTLFPEARVILNNNISYNASLKQKIKEKQIGCIALTDSANYNLDETYIINAGYHKLAELDLAANNETLTTAFYTADQSN